MEVEEEPLAEGKDEQSSAEINESSSCSTLSSSGTGSGPVVISGIQIVEDSCSCQHSGSLEVFLASVVNFLFTMVTVIVL